MTQTYGGSYPVRFPERRLKGRNKKYRPNFEPTELQISSAIRKITGVLNRWQGSYHAPVSKDDLHKRLVHELHCRRGDALGRTLHEEAITTRRALERMESEATICITDDPNGGAIVILKHFRKPKLRKEKYPKPVLRFRAA